MSMSKKVDVRVPKPMYEKLADLAYGIEGISISEIVRRAIDDYLMPKSEEYRSGKY